MYKTKEYEKSPRLYPLSLGPSANFRETGDRETIPFACNIILNKECRMIGHKERFNKEKHCFQSIFNTI